MGISSLVYDFLIGPSKITDPTVRPTRTHNQQQFTSDRYPRTPQLISADTYGDIQVNSASGTLLDKFLIHHALLS